MKKIVSLMVAIMLSGIIGGCGLIQPSWKSTLSKSSDDNYVYGVGVAQANGGDDYQFQVDEATLAAKAKITQQIISDTSDSLKQVISNKKLNKKVDYARMSKKINTSISKAKLVGVEVVEVSKDKETKDVFVLVSIPKGYATKLMNKTMADALKEETKNEEVAK